MSAEETFMEKLAHIKVAERRETVPVQLLGKQAARRFLDGESGTMTEAVTEIVKEADLNPEHARRVAESGNQAVWAHTKSSGERSQFEPANPDEVIGSLDRTPEDMGMPVLDYAQEPPGRVDAPEGDLYSMFGLSEPEQEKVASAKVGWRDVARIEGRMERARHDVDRLTLAMSSTGEELYQMVKQAHLEHGHSLGQMGRAVMDTCESSQFGARLVQQIATRADREGWYRLTDEQEKVASAEVLVIDHEHPILAAALSLETMATTHYSRQQNMEQARQEHLEASRTYRRM